MPTTTDHLRPVRIVLHIVFFLSGIATVLIGQVLPILAARFSLSDLEVGYLFPAQFAGSLTGTFLTNYFGKRGRLMAATIIGCVAMAAGVALLNSPWFIGCLIGFAVNGLGIGLTLPSINILVLELSGRNSASALNVLNFFWGAGAIVSKPFVDYVGHGGLLFPTLILAVPIIVGGAVLAVSPGTGERRTPNVDSPGSSRLPIWSTVVAWILALFNFLHIGFESGMGGWLTTFTDRVAPTASVLSPTVIYFFFFVAGRAAAPLFLRFINENRLLLVNLLTILIGMFITVMAGNVATLSLGAAVAGIGTSSVFPTTISRFSRVFGQEAMRRATPLFVSGTLGAAIVTWLIGFLSDRMADLRSGMYILAAAAVALVVLQIGLMLYGVGTAAQSTSDRR